jgi:hypothetical protein
MQTTSLNIAQLIFTVLFFGTLAAGGFLFKNFGQLFGPDPSIPSENSSHRTYGMTQAIVIWLHAVALTGAFAFFLL